MTILLLQSGPGSAGGAGGAGIGFDPATTFNATLSNNNLTATHSSTASNSGARVATTHGSGKYYFELKLNSAGAGDVVGLCTPANTYNNVQSTNATVIGAFPNGNLNVFAAFAGNIGGFIANDVIGFAIDFTAGLVWIRRNAGNWNGSGTANPATAVGGSSFTAGTALMPVVTFGTTGGENWTGNFGATAFANTAPAGFGNWG
jgi:hypothetical protein